MAKFDCDGGWPLLINICNTSSMRITFIPFFFPIQSCISLLKQHIFFVICPFADLCASFLCFEYKLLFPKRNDCGVITSAGTYICGHIPLVASFSLLLQLCNILEKEFIEKMGRQPCCDRVGLKRGPWTIEEDHKLVHFILNNGIQCWRNVPKLAGILFLFFHVQA